MAALAAVAVGVTAAACARQEPPPGGPQDQRPPVVVSTFPEAFAVLEDLGAAVRFEFDERISERVAGGGLDQAVTISPRGGVVRVKHSGRALSAEVEGGFRPGVVYRVTLQPVVNDMFGNTVRDPFELVFSTGAEASPTTIAGQVWNRVTGAGLNAAVVHAVGADSLVHQSVTNREGIYAFRYLPAGDFSVSAFEDVNRDGELDSTEVQGVVPASVAAGDTLLLDIAVLEPDTTPARISGADMLDSVTVVVLFDDFIDPEVPAESVAVGLSREGDEAPTVVRLFHESDYVEYVDAVTDSFARLDSIDAARAMARARAEAARAAAEGDTVAPDTAATGDPTPPRVVPEPPADTAVAPEAPADTAVARVPPSRLEPLQGVRAGPTADGQRELPGRRIVAWLDRALERDVEHQLDVSGVRNIFGLEGGGGVTTVMMASPPPDTTAVDTLAVPDTGVVLSRSSSGRLAPRPEELFRRR